MTEILVSGRPSAGTSQLQMPLVSVIVVNINGCVYLRRCINSILENRYPHWELIVVDNGSSDDSKAVVQEVSRQNSSVHLVALPNNVGPARARNIAAEHTHGDILAFLDNDTVVDPNWLSELVPVFARDASIGACQCKLLLEQQRDRIDYMGDYLGQFGFLVQRVPGGTLDTGQFDQCVELLSAKSAGMAIRRAAFDTAGGFDEDYFIYTEETDLGWRVWLSGYRIVLVPTSIVFHTFGTSGLILGDWQIYLSKYHGTKNYVSTLLKNLGTRSAVGIIPMHIVFWLGLSTYLVAIRKPLQALFVVEGLVWCLRHYRSLLAKRRAIQLTRKIDDKNLLPRVMRRVPLRYFIRKATGQSLLGNAKSWGAQ